MSWSHRATASRRTRPSPPASAIPGRMVRSKTRPPAGGSTSSADDTSAPSPRAQLARGIAHPLVEIDLHRVALRAVEALSVRLTGRRDPCAHLLLRRQGVASDQELGDPLGLLLGHWHDRAERLREA